jgi:hypothetical protein
MGKLSRKRHHAGQHRGGPTKDEFASQEAGILLGIQRVVHRLAFCEACGVLLTEENVSIWGGATPTLLCIPCRDFLGPLNIVLHGDQPGALHALRFPRD